MQRKVSLLASVDWFQLINCWESRRLCFKFALSLLAHRICALVAWPKKIWKTKSQKKHLNQDKSYVLPLPLDQNAATVWCCEIKWLTEFWRFSDWQIYFSCNHALIDFKSETRKLSNWVGNSTVIQNEIVSFKKSETIFLENAIFSCLFSFSDSR